MTFEELLEDNGISIAPPGHHHQTHGWLQFDCPFCGKDSHKYHMGYNAADGYINCWRCGGHSILSALSELLNIPIGRVKKLLKDLDHPYVSKKQDDFRKKLNIPFPIGPLKRVHEHYLKKRGYDLKELQQLWQIKGIGLAGKWSWRIFIPIINKGKTVSWTTRSLRDKGQRYVSADKRQELLPHKQLIYGEDYIRDVVIITEGPFDVWKIGPGAVCTFGTAFSHRQVMQLCNVPHRYICFDNEKNAQKQAQKLTNALGPFPGETTNILLNAHDPGSAKDTEIRKLRKLLR